MSRSVQSYEDEIAKLKAINQSQLDQIRREAQQLQNIRLENERLKACVYGGSFRNNSALGNAEKRALHAEKLVADLNIRLMSLKRKQLTLNADSGALKQALEEKINDFNQLVAEKKALDVEKQSFLKLFAEMNVPENGIQQFLSNGKRLIEYLINQQMMFQSYVLLLTQQNAALTAQGLQMSENEKQLRAQLMSVTARAVNLQRTCAEYAARQMQQQTQSRQQAPGIFAASQTSTVESLPLPFFIQKH